MKIGRNIAVMIAAHAAIATAHQDPATYITDHIAAADPHGDEAYANGLIAARAPSFEEIAEVVLTAPAALVEAADIPAGYAAFLLLWHDVYGDNAAVQRLYLTFNGDGGANYDYAINPEDFVSAAENAATYIVIGMCGDTDGVEQHSNGFLNILNRAGQEKICQGTQLYYQKAGGNAEDVVIQEHFGKWRNVADEISTITVTVSVGNFVPPGRWILLGMKT